MPDLPTRGIVRGARLASLPAAYVGRRAVGLGRRVGGRPAEAIATEVQRRTADQLFAVLGELKGGAMKVGQWMSAMEAALPEQLAGPYAESLTRLQEAAPAMPKRTVHRVLSESLGKDWQERFDDFADEPAAAASIGQVHRAVWSDGRSVAVKVQYPGAGEALATDLRQLDRLVPLVRVAAPGLDARNMFAELRARVMAEVDYQQEAEAQTAFADEFRDDADFLVPDVVAVSDRVLVSEWVGGTPVSSIARRGDLSQRERVAHSLKGASGIFGVYGLTERCAALAPTSTRRREWHQEGAADALGTLPFPDGFGERDQSRRHVARVPAALPEIRVADIEEAHHDAVRESRGFRGRADRRSPHARIHVAARAARDLARHLRIRVRLGLAENLDASRTTRDHPAIELADRRRRLHRRRRSSSRARELRTDRAGEPDRRARCRPARARLPPAMTPRGRTPPTRSRAAGRRLSREAVPRHPDRRTQRLRRHITTG